MIDFTRLIKSTNAYKMLCKDKKEGRLAHAYLIVNADKTNSKEYLKEFAKVFFCQSENACNTCRTCRLISENTFSDVFIYPQEAPVSVEDITSLISESYIKPFESDKKVFMILDGEEMSAVVQNKLLKTLEEPPKNVYILIGATSEYSLLPTIKSRVRKLEVSAFSNTELYEALIKDYTDSDKLKTAISCGDGTVGKAVALYENEKTQQIIDCVTDVLVNMKSSADVLTFSNKISKLKCDITEFLSVLELALRDLLTASCQKGELINNTKMYKKTCFAEGFSTGAIVYALDAVGNGYKRLKANANATMLYEWLLFQILEGKYKWRK